MWTHTGYQLTNVLTGYRVQFDGNIITPIHASNLAYVRLGVIVRALVGSVYIQGVWAGGIQNYMLMF